MDGYLFTLDCSLQSQVDPIADFQFYITQNFSGGFSPLTEDITANIIDILSETNWTITVRLNSSFIFPETGVIQVNCTVSNSNGNDSVTTSVRLCGKYTS